MDKKILEKIILYMNQMPASSAKTIKKELKLNYSTVTIYKKLKENGFLLGHKNKYEVDQKKPDKKHLLFIFSVTSFNIEKPPNEKIELYRYELVDFHSSFIYYYISKDKNLIISSQILDHFFSDILDNSIANIKKSKIQIITNKSPEFYSKNRNNHIDNLIIDKFNSVHKTITPYHKKKILSTCSDCKSRYTHRTSNNNSNDNDFIDIYMSIADSFSNKNSYQLAKEIYFLGYKIALRKDKPYDIIRYLFKIGNINLIMGNFEKAEKYYFETISKSKVNNSHVFHIRAKGNIALIKMIKNDYNSAEIEFIEVLNLTRKYKLTILETHALGNLAIVYDNKNEIKKSLSYYIKVLWRYKSSNDINNFAITLGNIALILKRMKEYSRSEKFFYKQINISERIKNYSSLGLAYSNLSTLHRDLEHYSKATKYNSLSISMLSTANDKYYLCIAYIERTKLLLRENKFSLSTDSLEKAFSLNKDINNTDYWVEIEVLRKILLIHRELKQSNVLSKSIIKLLNEIVKLKDYKILKTDKRYRRTYNLYIIYKYLYEILVFIKNNSSFKVIDKILNSFDIKKYETEYLKYKDFILGVNRKTT